MIAFPTPTFDAKTIQSAPGYRPTGKSGMTMKTDQPEAETPLTKPNRKTRNGGYFNHGVIDDIPKKYNYANGTPLSKPDANGNQVDTMLILQPRYAEPRNDMMNDVISILNGKVIPSERKGNLTPGQIKALDERQKKLSAPKSVAEPLPTITDFAETQRQMTKEKMIRNAMADGFTREEAVKGYNKLKEEEVVAALKKERQPSEQLREIMDSRYGTGEEGRAGVGNANVPQIVPLRTSRGVGTDISVGEGMTLAVRPSKYKKAEEVSGLEGIGGAGKK